MKDVFLLTKILLKNSLNKNNGKQNSEKGKIILYILVYGYIVGFVAYVAYACISSLIPLNQEILFLNICFSGVIFLGIIQTLFTSLNFLFFSKDIENLLPLPITPLKIIMSKFNCIIISQYFVCTAILFPVLITYGVLLNCAIQFYLVSLLIIALLPIVPVTISSFLIILVMKATKIVKNKEAVQYLSVFLTIALVIGIQILSSSRSGNNITNMELAENLVSKENTINNSYKFLFTLKPAINSIINYNNLNGVKNLIILFIESLIIYVTVCYIVAKKYIKSVTSFISKGNKEGKKINSSKVFFESKLWKTYVKKEFKILVRNPIFFMQCILPSILFPFIFSIPLVVEFKKTESQNISILTEYFAGDINNSVGFGITLVIILVLYIFNFISITAISRDGRDALFMKHIPLSMEKQIFYKILPGIILNIIPTLYVLVFEKILISQVSLEMILSVCIISMLFNIFNNYLVILIDLKNPKLNWISEYAVVKQNFNMLFQFIIIIIECGIIVGICGYLSLQKAQSILFITVIIGIVFIRRYIKSKQIKIFNKIN